MSRKSFGEFMQFSPKGLDTFKIQTEFKCSLFPIFSNYVGNFNFFPKGKSFHLNLHSTLKCLEIFGIQ
jgi:hypothetical protein